MCWRFLLMHFVTVKRVTSGYIFLLFCHRTCPHSSHSAVLSPVWRSAFQTAAWHGSQLKTAICRSCTAPEPTTALEMAVVATITVTYLQSDVQGTFFFFFFNSYPNMSLPLLDKTFILRNCIQQIELGIDIPEELQWVPLTPTRGLSSGTQFKMLLFLSLHLSCTYFESFSHFHFWAMGADRGLWLWEQPGTFPPFSHRDL